MNCSLPGSSVHNFPGKNVGVGFHFLLQGIFPTQASNPHLLCLLQWQVDSLQLCLLGSYFMVNHWGMLDQDFTLGKETKVYQNNLL